MDASLSHHRCRCAGDCDELARQPSVLCAKCVAADCHMVGCRCDEALCPFKRSCRRPLLELIHGELHDD